MEYAKEFQHNFIGKFLIANVWDIKDVEINSGTKMSLLYFFDKYLQNYEKKNKKDTEKR